MNINIRDTTNGYIVCSEDEEYVYRKLDVLDVLQKVSQYLGIVNLKLEIKD